MKLQSSAIIGGPAYIEHDGALYYTEDNITVQIEKRLKESRASHAGHYDDTLLDVVAQIQFTPKLWRNLSALFHLLTLPIGGRVMGSVDKPVVIYSVTEGQVYTYSRGAITTMPQLGLGINKTLLGQTTITAIKADGTALSAANSVVALTSESWDPDDEDWDPAKDFDVPYEVKWGSTAPYDSMDTEEGVDVSWDYTLEEISSDLAGLVDMKLTSKRATFDFVPLGLSHAELLALHEIQGTGISRGSKLGATKGRDLIIRGPSTDSPQVTAKATFPVNPQLRHGASAHLPGTIQFATSRQPTAGVFADPVTIGTRPAPD
ncbi:MAG: hypothetical protein JJT75_15140 [Opitutales bacterium]|nr:hypothetical protein [Opitutales bacterium]